MNKSLICLLLLGLFFFSCVHDPIYGPIDQQLKFALEERSPNSSYAYYKFPASDDFASIPNQEVSNPLTAEKVELGKMLFHETALAAAPAYPISESTFSCATCHIAEKGFTPGQIQGIADGAIGFGDHRIKISGYEGDEVDAQGARPLSVLNVAYVTNTLWSGQFGSYGVNEGTEDLWHVNPASEVNFEYLAGIEAQNIEGMKLHRMEVTPLLLDGYGYREHFDKCFPEIPIAERYSIKTVSFALAAYLRTLFAQEAPFQKWLNGDEAAMTDQQKRGALLFLGKANCANCHKGPSFNALEFHALGTPDLYEHGDVFRTAADDKRNLGRAFFTGKAEDENRFKVPQLYNLKDYTHFFHGSSKTDLREVIKFKLKAESENPRVSNDQLSNFFLPVDLTESEIDDLISFLEDGLYDDNLQRYVPDHVLSGNCIPNNDLFSQNDLGCQ